MTQPDLARALLAQGPPRSVAEMRALQDRYAGLLNADLPAVGAFHEAVPVRPGLTADVVVPAGAGPHPLLVYLHGGGWVSGSAATHRKLAHRFAEGGYLVVNVDYRLAPEHPFPAGLEDCVEAIRWAAREAPRFGGDPARLAVGGDSAGANLAAAAAIVLADDPARPRAALLLYGVFDFADFGELPGQLADTPLGEIGRRLVAEVSDAYLGSGNREALLRDPRVSPIHAAGRLPPSHLVVGSADPLAVQAEALAKALAAAGVPHEHHVDPGMPHAYLQMEFLEATRPARERMLAFLRARV